MLTMKGEKIMKCLEIKDGKGYYLKATGEMCPLDQMKKEISNQAHQIIYSNLFEKFSDLLTNKNRFLDESEQLYREALQKYQV